VALPRPLLGGLGARSTGVGGLPPGLLLCIASVQGVVHGLDQVVVRPRPVLIVHAGGHYTRGLMPDLPHDFADPALLQLALTHASVNAGTSNQRLEFLGDAVLDLVVAEELFRQEGQPAEGLMTELKASVVSRQGLAEVGRDLGLAERGRFGGGLKNRALPASVLANLYEAVVGAVYLDAGYPAARAFALATMAAPLARARAGTTARNPKQALQELSQARWGEPPRYELLRERGSDHARAFQMSAVIADRRFPSAWGRTHKEAEGWAAHEALLVLEGASPASGAPPPAAPGEAD